MLEKDLEGKYFAFDFYADYTDDTSGLAILQVKEGQLQEAWHPCDHLPTFMLDEFGSVVSELARTYLIKNQIREVFTLGDGIYAPRSPPDIFLGYTLHWNNENGWGHYDSLDQHFWKSFFQEADITLKFYKYF